VSKPEPALCAGDVAALLNVPESTVFSLWRRHLLRGLRVGKHLRFRREWVDDYVTRSAVPPLPRDGTTPSPLGEGA
jgi:excisionase family DNA binding protein